MLGLGRDTRFASGLFLQPPQTRDTDRRSRFRRDGQQQRSFFNNGRPPPQTRGSDWRSSFRRDGQQPRPFFNSASDERYHRGWQRNPPHRFFWEGRHRSDRRSSSLRDGFGDYPVQRSGFGGFRNGEGWDSLKWRHPISPEQQRRSSGSVDIVDYGNRSGFGHLRSNWEEKQRRFFWATPKSHMGGATSFRYLPALSSLKGDTDFRYRNHAGMHRRGDVRGFGPGDWRCNRDNHRRRPVELDPEQAACGDVDSRVECLTGGGRPAELELVQPICSIKGEPAVHSVRGQTPNVGEDSFKIESKIFNISICSSNLEVRQLKGNISRAISFCLEGASWLSNAVLSLQTGGSDSWDFTRFEDERNLKLSLDSNDFGRFLLLVELRHGGRTSLIIPMGRDGEGFRKFSNAVAKQVLKLKACRENLSPTLDGDPCTDLAVTEGGFQISISGHLFLKDLQDLGYVARPALPINFIQEEHSKSGQLNVSLATPTPKGASSSGCQPSVGQSSPDRSSGSKHPAASDIILNEDGTLCLKGGFNWTKRKETLSEASISAPKTEVTPLLLKAQKVDDDQSLISQVNEQEDDTFVDAVQSLNAQDSDTTIDADQSFTPVISKRNRKKLVVQSSAMQTRLQSRLKDPSLG